MPNIVLDGDMSTGHAGFPPVPAHATSTVSLNGKNIVLHGDPYDSHTNTITHVNPTAVGTSSITINGKKIILAGDSLSCGDTTTSSSSAAVN